MNERLIYDIGMHNGDDTAYYLSKGYHVIAIDASPDLVAKANKRFSNEINNNKLSILNLGIGAEEGSMDFYLNKKNSVWNSFDKEIGERGGAGFDVIKVKTDSLDHVMNNYGVPYYMKIDIEGNDIFCLISLTDCTEKPAYISVEVNGEELIHKLHELGYTKFKIIDQFKFLPLEIPVFREFAMYKKHYAFKHSMNFFIRVARKLIGKNIDKYYEKQNRKLFDYDHPEGSSGPFAEHLPGTWSDYGGILKVYRFYKQKFESSNRFVGYNFWIDIHATK
jgi:FkbM family methyltransferase